MDAVQTSVVEGVIRLQADRDELLKLLAAVSTADSGPDEDGKHVTHVPADVMAAIHARLN